MKIHHYFFTILLCMSSAALFCSKPAQVQSGPPGGASVSSLPPAKPKMKRLAQLSMTTTKLPSGELVKNFKLTIPSKGEYCSQTVTITPPQGESLDHKAVVTVDDWDHCLEKDRDPSKLHMKTMYSTGSGPFVKDCQAPRFLKRSDHLKIFAHQILMMQELPSSVHPKPECYKLEEIEEAKRRFNMKRISLCTTQAQGETYISDDEEA